MLLLMLHARNAHGAAVKVRYDYESEDQYWWC